MSGLSLEERRAVYERALATWGADAQIMMAIEEMSELTKELCKHHRGRENREEIADEIADVTIMMEQLRLIFALDEKVREHMDMKVRRLRGRLEGMTDG